MIETLFGNARRIKTSRFLVSYATLDIKTPCISMVVSKKHAKSAVLRNRLRRKGYAAVAPFVSKIKPTIGILVNFNDGNPDFANTDMRTELDGVFQKAGLYK